MKQLISQVLHDLVLKSPDYRDARDGDIAAAFGISPAAYSNYKEDKRVPEWKTARKMAQRWAQHLNLPKESPEIEEIANSLKNARADEPRLLFPGLMHQEIGLKVSTLDLGVFRDFFKSVFTSYANQAGMLLDLSERKCSEHLRDNLVTGDVHVALCALDVVSRLLWARFLPLFPIRLSLSAVGLFPSTAGAMSEEVRNLSEALSRGGGVSPVKYTPLVVAEGVGELHCRHKLNMNKSELEIAHTLDPPTLVAHLKRIKKNSDTRPVLICDEYTCIRVLNELKYEGRLIFPLTTRDHVRQIPVRQQLPRYLACIAISREQKDFWEFLQESIVNFVGRELYTVAEAAADLYHQLEREVVSATKYMYRWGSEDGYSSQGSAVWKPQSPLDELDGPQLAGQYCRYVLHMDTQSVSAAASQITPWLPLLRRAREIMYTSVWRQKIYCYDPASEPQDAVVGSKVRSLLNELAAQYRMITTTKAVEHIDYDANNLAGRYGAEQGRILLAYEGLGATDSDTSYIGLLCLTRENTQKQNNACQLRYLWVNPVFHGQRVGEVLIQEAIRYAARELKVAKVYVEVMPSLEHAIRLFRQSGFKPDAHKPEYPDRLVFEFPLLHRGREA